MEPLANAAEVALAGVVRRIGKPGFEAALDAFLTRAIGIDNLVVLAFSDAARPRVLYRRHAGQDVFGALEAVYLTGAWLLDPVYGLHLARVPAGAFRLRDVAPDAFSRSRYFREYYGQTGLSDEMAFFTWPQPALSVTISLGREARAPTFDARAVAACRRLAPVVAALAEAHWADLAPPGPAPAANLAPALAEAAGPGLRLTPRQAEVALLILRGHSTPSIGLRLGVSPQTVKVFRKQLYARCGISSQAGLFALMLPLLRGLERGAGR